MRKLYYSKSVRVSVAGVVLCFFSMMFWVFALKAQSIDNLQSQISIVRDLAKDNTYDLKMLNSQVARNTADIMTLTASVAELVAATNKLSGIGIAIGALGGIIFIFQSVSLVKQKRSGGA